MKLKSLVVATTLCTSLSFAGAASANGGLYSGISLDWVDAGTELSAETYKQESLSTSGVGGTLYFGYEHALPGGYVGFEANIAESAAEYKERYNGEAASLTRELSYGVAALLGTNLNQSTSLYGILGYQVTNFELSGKVDGIGKQTTDEGFGGVRAGVGVKSDITDMLSLRLQWSRTFYGEETMELDELNSGDLDFDIRENVFSLGIQGRF